MQPGQVCWGQASGRSEQLPLLQDDCKGKSVFPSVSLLELKHHSKIQRLRNAIERYEFDVSVIQKPTCFYPNLGRRNLEAKHQRWAVDSCGLSYLYAIIVFVHAMFRKQKDLQ